MGQATPALSIFGTTSWRCRWKSFGHRIRSRRKSMGSNTPKALPGDIAEKGERQKMNNPLAEDYLRWLVPQIRDEQSDLQYWDLFSLMFEKNFVSLVPNDEN